MQVPCGRCAECQTNLSNQWYYRTWYEWQDLVACNGYVLFDTLTYAPKHLPMLSNTWSCLDKTEDFPCFEPIHIRRFLQLLRQRLIRAGYSKNAFRYFLTSEYGSDSRYTHRPHYHILLFVYDNNIDPLYLSRLIGDIWQYGRTDGLPYKNVGYVLGKRVFRADCGLVSRLWTCKYVSKYVQKSCQFQHEIDRRLNKVMFRLAEFVCQPSDDMSNTPLSPEDWLDTEEAHRERLKLLRYVNQFHRQSQHFGESALADLDLNQLFRDGCLYMPDPKGLKIPIPFPMYYKRKIFYDLVEYRGSRYWILNELGEQFKRVRYDEIRQRLIQRYECVCVANNLDYDCSALADYVLEERGRILADLPSANLIQRMPDVNLYNYSTCSDKLQFGCRGLTTTWLGDSQCGYLSNRIDNRISLQSFIQHCVFFDAVKEKQLDNLFMCMQKSSNGKQKLFELKQRLKNLYKHKFPLLS